VKDIGVVYLCRHSEGDTPVLRFLNSLRNFPAGTDYDLHVVFKGFPDAGELHKRQALFRGLGINTIETDDIGYDIDTYLFAANAVGNRRLLFFNTFSRILAPDWLKHFEAALNEPSVGLVGATGSWQSAPTSYERALRTLLLKTLELDARLKSRVRRVLRLPGRPPDMSSSGGNGGVYRMTDAELQQLKRPAWRYFIAPFLYLRALYGYHRFPNPHIRTNAFMIDRQVFLSLRFPQRRTKSEMYKFESGRRSLTNQVIALGLKPVVVDRHGRTYAIIDWRSSATFWCNNQMNLLVSDNRTDGYQEGTRAFRDALENSAWNHPWKHG
jgi:hypothetical protein